MSDLGDVEGVYEHAIRMLRKGGAEHRMLGRILSRKVKTGVGAVFAARQQPTQAGRPKQVANHREIAGEVYALKQSGVVRKQAYKIVAEKHGLAERTIKKIYEQSRFGREGKFLQNAADWGEGD